MFYKILTYMLLVGMSCVDASQKSAGSATEGKVLSQEELRKAYDRISKEIEKLNDEKLTIEQDAEGKDTIPKIKELLNQIKALGTYTFWRNHTEWQQGRSNIWSIYLIESLLEKVFALKPKKEVRVWVAQACWDAVNNEIIPFQHNEERKNYRKAFIQYFNAQNFETYTSNNIPENMIGQPNAKKVTTKYFCKIVMKTDKNGTNYYALDTNYSNKLSSDPNQIIARGLRSAYQGGLKIGGI